MEWSVPHVPVDEVQGVELPWLLEFTCCDDVKVRAAEVIHKLLISDTSRWFIDQLQHLVVKLIKAIQNNILLSWKTNHRASISELFERLNDALTLGIKPIEVSLIANVRFKHGMI